MSQSSLVPPEPDDMSPDADHTTGDRYVVVARRYRPQTFDELVGQQHVGRALSSAIASGRVGHAYLFTGARGVGKTSSARILAKCLNCETGPTATPCNQCDICRGITSGDDVDVLEIDGASNRGIDEIRQLRANAGVRPSRSRFKIYIIDEVHMLTTPAFNALLKTLEEPPEHVKFIFCTTEPNKIPITILSRCQRFDFGGIQTTSIIERLRQICQAEGVQANDEALEVIARRAAGSMRDSQSLLEQLLAFGGETIAASDVHSLLGSADDLQVAQLAEHLQQRDAAAALAALDRAVAEGCDVGQLMEQLLGYLRDAMAAAVGCSAEALQSVSSGQFEGVRRLAEAWGLETILAALGIVDRTLISMKMSVHGRTLAETALVRICRLDDLDTLPALIDQLRSGTPPAATGSPGRAAGNGPARRAPGGDAPAASGGGRTGRSPTGPRAAAEEIAADGPQASVQAPHASAAALAAPATAAQGATASNPEVPSRGVALTEQNVESVWKQAVAALGQSDLVADHASLYESLAILAPNRLAVRFQQQYTLSKQMCERPEQAGKLRQALADVVGSPVGIDFELVAISSAAPEQTPQGSVAGRAGTQRQLLAQRAEHPLVKQAMEMFDAQPIKVVAPDLPSAD